MKRFLSIFLTLILIFNTTIVSFSYADTIDDLTQVGFEDVSATDTSGENNVGENDYEELDTEPGMDSIINKIINSVFGIISWIHTPLILLILGMPTIDGCIFNSQNYFKLTFFDSNPDGLAGGLQGYIGAAYNAFRYLVTAAYIVILVYLGVRMILSSVGRQKAQYKELFRHWLIGLLILFSFHWVMAGLIWLSNEFVMILSDISSNSLNLAENISSNSLFDTNVLTTLFNNSLEKSPVTSFILYNISNSTAAVGVKIWNVPLAAFFYLLLLGAGLTIAFTYLKRLFTIALLILLFPFVALSYVFDKIGDRKAQTLSNWLKEFTVNVLIQPIHALILVLISIVYSTGIGNNFSLYGPTTAGTIMSLLTLLLIPMAEKLLKQLFQISSNMGPARDGIGRSLAQAGLAITGAQKLGSSLKNTAATARIMASERNGMGLKNKLKAAKDGINNNPNLNKQQKRETYKNQKKDLYDTYRQKVLKKTGAKTMAGARAKAMAEIGMTGIGIGTALTSSDSLSGFLANAGTNAATGTAVLQAGHSIKTAIWGDAHSSKDYRDRINTLKNTADLSTLTNDQKKTIATELNIDVSMVNNANRQMILNDYENLERYARFTGTTDKEQLKSILSNPVAVKNILEGKSPNGSSDFNPANFKAVSQNSKGMVIADNTTGQQYFIDTAGNDRLRETITAEGRDKEAYITKDSRVQTIESRIETLKQQPASPENRKLLAEEEKNLRKAKLDAEVRFNEEYKEFDKQFTNIVGSVSTASASNSGPANNATNNSSSSSTSTTANSSPINSTTNNNFSTSTSTTSSSTSNTSSIQSTSSSNNSGFTGTPSGSNDSGYTGFSSGTPDNSYNFSTNAGSYTSTPDIPDSPDPSTVFAPGINAELTDYLNKHQKFTLRITELETVEGPKLQITGGGEFALINGSLTSLCPNPEKGVTIKYNTIYSQWIIQ